MWWGLVTFCFLLAHVQGQIVVYVNATSDSDPATCGASWAQACSTLLTGVEVACASQPDEAWLLVAGGVYDLSESINVTCPLHIISTQGSNQTIISVDPDIQNPLLFQGPDQQMSWNASLSGFTFYYNNSPPTNLSTSIHITGSFYEFYLSDIAWINGSLSSAVAVTGSVAHLYLTEWSIEYFSFDQHAVLVADSDTVHIEGWSWNTVRLHSVSTLEPVGGLHISANSSISMSNVSWNNITGSMELPTQLSWMSSPSVELQNITLWEVVIFSGFGWKTGLETVISLDNFTCTQSHFHKDVFDFTSLNEDFANSFQFNVTSSMWQDTTTDTYWVYTIGTFSSVTLHWYDVSWNNGSLGMAFPMNEGVQQMDIHWNSILIAQCKLEMLVNTPLRPYGGLTLEGTGVTLRNLTPRDPSLLTHLIECNGPNSIILENLEMLSVKMPFISAVQVSNLTLVNAIFESNTCDTMIGLLQGYMYVRNLTMTHNQVLYGLYATSSFITAQNIQLQSQKTNLYVVVYFANCTYWFNGVNATENESSSPGGVFYVANSRGSITNSSFANNNAQIGGAITATFGELKVANSQFSQNKAIGGNGAAIAVESSGVLKVTDCEFDSNNAAFGGALCVNDATMHVERSTFRTNSATEYGGCIFATGNGHLTIHSSQFHYCQATQEGGGLAYQWGKLNMTETEFYECSAPLGGAVYIENVNFSIANSMFSQNHGIRYGGDLYSTGSRGILTHNIFNKSLSPQGGSLYWTSRSYYEIFSSLFLSASAKQSGGAIGSHQTHGSIHNSTFDGCHTEGVGGAIQSHDISLQISTSNFTGCESILGGAIEVSNGTITLSSTSFMDNLAHKGGGALYIFGGVENLLTSVKAFIASSNFQNNSAQIGGGILVSQTATLDIKQSVLERNSAVTAGGAIYTEDQAIITMDNSTLRNNTVTGNKGYGGALYVRYQASASVNGSRFLNNAAPFGGAVAGNSQLDPGLRLQFYQSDFIGNIASAGGALNLLGETTWVLDSCNCSNNQAANGGAFYAAGNAILEMVRGHMVGNQAERGGVGWMGEEASLNDSNSHFSSNIADYGAGIYLSGNSIAQLEGSSFESNSAVLFGGAILFTTLYESNKIENTTFLANRAEHGGGVYIDSLAALPSFSNCTWQENYAGQMGAAIFLPTYGQSSTSLLSNCVFRYNFAEYGGCNIACTQVAEQHLNTSLLCLDCDYGTPPENYTGYQNKEQFASGPALLSTSDCSRSIPLDDPEFLVSASLQDGFGTTVTGPLLVDQPFVIQGHWPNGVDPSSNQSMTLPETGVLTFPELTVCGNNYQQFLLLFSASSPGMANLSAECTVELSGCSSPHFSPRAGIPCGHCGIDALIVVPLVLLALLIVTVCCVLCCVIIICTKGAIKRYRLRTMQVPDLTRDGYSLEDLLADSAIVRLNWSDVEFGAVLGKGASGLVRKAIWKRGPTSQEIATKELLMAEDEIDGEIVMEFCKEIKYMSSLHHPNVVAVVGIILSPDRVNVYLASELMSRGSLYDLVSKKGANIPLSLRFRIAIDAAEGMTFIHSKNVIHRDLKSHNLLINAEWKTKIADFGISTINPTITRRMTCVGTPIYMAPEVLQREVYSARADVYSFGIVLCELFTNRRPYSQPPFDSMNVAILTHQIIEASARPSLEGLHPTLQNLIEECWTSNPHSRPSFAEVTARLKRLRNDLVNGNETNIELDVVVDDSVAHTPFEPSERNTSIQ